MREELLYSLKCLALTAVLLVLMQLKVGGYSIEARVHHWFQTSKVSLYVQSVAAGGILAGKNLVVTVKNGIAGTVDSYQRGSEEQARR